MKTDSSHMGGSLVLRVWVESGHDSPFRARITTFDQDHEQQTRYADSVTAVCDIISDWVREILDTVPRDA